MPRRAAFSRAASAASSERSEAVTRRSGRSLSRARAIAPEPVPTSCTRAPFGSSTPTATSSSVSRRGISTRSSTAISISRKRQLPRMYSSGSRSLRRATSRSISSRTSAEIAVAPSSSRSSTLDRQRLRHQHLRVRLRRLTAGRGNRLRCLLHHLTGARHQRRSFRLGFHGYNPATGLIGSVGATRDRLPCRRRTAAIQIAPASIIARLSHCAVVSPSATASLRRRNSTRKRSAPA